MTCIVHGSSILGGFSYQIFSATTTQRHSAVGTIQSALVIVQFLSTQLLESCNEVHPAVRMMPSCLHPAHRQEACIADHNSTHNVEA